MKMKLGRPNRRLWAAACSVVLVATLLIKPSTALAQSPAKAPYLDTTLSLDERVNDLLARMTMDEKISILGETQPAIPRLGIAKYHFGNEALHGVVRPGKFTVFPMSIGLASTWDPDLIHEMTVAISDEARARYNADHGEMETIPPPHGLYNGLLTFWSPTINMARDPRWGRTGETYGEDPYLAGRLAVAFVRGLQGDDPRYLKVVSTPKHFAAYNQEKDRMRSESNMSIQALYEYYLPAFRAAIVEGHAESIMTSYNAINGVPSTMNHWLLTDLLRNDWKFKGFVVTDCGAVSNLSRDKGFHFGKDLKEAAELAINAGVDVECGGTMQKNLGQAVADGAVSTSTIDRATGNLLRAKFRLGMFDPQEMVPYSKIISDVIGSPEHEKIALQLARESMVLLKNAPYRGKPLLPLARKSLHSIAIVGPNAAVAQFGDYSGEPIHTAVTPLVGINAAVATNTAIKYIPYAKPDAKQSTVGGQEFEKEVEAARTSDVVIAFLGFGTESAREGQDRDNLDLPKDQQDMIRKVVAANPRTIVVLISGGPIAVEWANEHAPAILQAWYPGEQGGTAIADVLFGKVNPAGRLPLTFYRSTDQLPPMGDYEISHGRTYRYFTGSPLYPFGHGLSYTEFTYSKLTLDKTKAKAGDVIHATVDITNHGAVDGDEVVQLYFHQENGLANRPIRQLGAFRRVSIAKGKTSTVNLDLPVESLQVYSEERKGFVLYPGNVSVEVGASSADIRVRESVTIDTAAMP